MKNTYFDLIEQSYYFPQDGFDIHDGYLTFHGVSLKYLIEKYGTPFRLMYLPRIGEQIKRAKNLFNRAIKNNNYSGKYEYCYCTKCCHFYHVVSEALKYDVQLETSSSFDIDLIRCLYQNGQIDKQTKIIHNGFKTDEYVEKIKGGWTDVDVIITMPTIMAKIGALGKVLGPRGLMPNPKSGTVTMDIAKAVTEVKAGKIDFKVDKFGIIHASIGKVSFAPEAIVGNAKEFVGMVNKLKPVAAKGTYVKSIYISSTMSPGIQVDTKSLI